MSTTTLVKQDIIINKERLHQCKEEADAWKRTVQFLQSENSYMQVRLTYLLHLNISHAINTEATSLQMGLKRQEVSIMQIKHMFSDFDLELDSCDCTNESLKSVLKTRNNIRHKLEQLENAFRTHRRVFNTRVTDYM